NRLLIQSRRSLQPVACFSIGWGSRAVERGWRRRVPARSVSPGKPPRLPTETKEHQHLEHSGAQRDRSNRSSDQVDFLQARSNGSGYLVRWTKDYLSVQSLWQLRDLDLRQ